MASLPIYTDTQRSVLFTRTQKRICYSPFGSGLPGHGAGPRYTGTYTEPVAGMQAYGNGYRIYSPSLARFVGPDRHSPFGTGGANGYAYCLADPVNRLDRSGRFSTALIAPLLGIAASVVSLGALAAFQIDRQPRGYLRRATQLGVLGAVVGLAGGVWRLADPESESAQAVSWAGTTIGIAATGVRSLHYLSSIKAQQLGMGQIVSRFADLLPFSKLGQAELYAKKQVRITRM